MARLGGALHWRCMAAPYGCTLRCRGHTTTRATGPLCRCPLQAGLKQLLWLETLIICVVGGVPAVVALLRQLLAASGLTADLQLHKAAGARGLSAAKLPPPFQVSLRLTGPFWLEDD